MGRYVYSIKRYLQYLNLWDVNELLIFDYKTIQTYDKLYTHTQEGKKNICQLNGIKYTKRERELNLTARNIEAFNRFASFPNLISRLASI